MAKKDSILYRTQDKWQESDFVNILRDAPEDPDDFYAFKYLKRFLDSPFMGLVNPQGYVLKEAYQYMKDVFRDNPDEPDDYYLGKWRDKRKERGDWVLGNNITERRAGKKEAGEDYFGKRIADRRAERKEAGDWFVGKKLQEWRSPEIVPEMDSEEDDTRSLMERFSDWRDRKKARRKDKETVDALASWSEEGPLGSEPPKEDSNYRSRSFLNPDRIAGGARGTRYHSQGYQEAMETIDRAKAAHRRVLNYEGGEQVKK